MSAPAPNVPPPLNRNYATRVILYVEIKEHMKTLSDGVTYTYWTFGDETPGSFIRVREGDLVEVHLSNHPDNKLAHNIDFHGATGPGGGGEASFTAPGRTSIFTWLAMRAGLFLYHCVAAPAGLHIANGMYGLILVEPKGGLPKMDKEYCVVQGEFYTQGAYGEKGLHSFSMDKALKEEPEYVVFNGSVGSLMGDKALKAKVGEKVRIYLGNAGPSLVSSFHIVGEIFDRVYSEGGVLPNQRNVQTTLVPVGGSAMVEFTVDVPGEYMLVDHSMFRAFNKGTMGMLKVEGPGNDLLYSGKMYDKAYHPSTPEEALAVAGDPTPETPAMALTRDGLMKKGGQVYATVCFTCHQTDGNGLPNVFPPLAKSNFLMADKERSIRIVMHGLTGKVTVNGQAFKSEMPNPKLNDEQIASVLTYVRNHFGNQGEPVTVAEVAKIRSSAPDVGPLTVVEASGEGPKQVASKTGPRPHRATPRSGQILSRGPEED